MSVEAKNCKCIVCGEQAYKFYPVFDLDIEPKPYCKECLRKHEIALTLSYYTKSDFEKILKMLYKKKK